MKKILLPTLDYVPQTGGVARYIRAIEQTVPDVKVSYWKGHSTHVFFTFFRLLKEGVGYKTIWTHHLFPLGTAAYLVKIATRKPYTVFLHGLDFDLARRTPLRAWVAKRILKSAKNVVTNTNALKGEVDRFAGVRSIVVHPVVDDGLVEASKVMIAAHRCHEEVVLLTVARLVSRKGHEDVLRMLPNMKGVRYHIVGDGVQRAYLEELVQELGLEDRVEMQQGVSDKKLADLYRQTDIFIMPTKKTATDREGFGIVYLEAQLFGVPVIATDHPGVDEALVDGVSGLLVKDDAMQLKRAVKKLAKDPDLRKRMGRAGREFVLAGFTRAAEMKKLRALL